MFGFLLSQRKLPGGGKEGFGCLPPKWGVEAARKTIPVIMLF